MSSGRKYDVNRYDNDVYDVNRFDDDRELVKSVGRFEYEDLERVREALLIALQDDGRRYSNET